MKPTFTLLGAILLALCITTVAYAQENYKPGYVITANGDTIKGLINYRNWEQNPNKITFKADEASAKTNYTPLDIQKFGVADELYESAIVQAETSTITVANLDKSPTLRYRTDTTFVQTLISGPKSLYHYKDSFAKDNFYIKSDTAFEILVYKKYTQEINSRTLIKENKQYIGQLTMYMADCPTIYDRLENTIYTKSSLTKVFTQYYACSQPDVVFTKRSDNYKLEIGVLAGITQTHMDPKAPNFTYMDRPDFSKSTNATGGIFLNVKMPRNLSKWSLYNELMVTQHESEGQYNEYQKDNWYTNNTTTLGATYLKLNNLVRYSYSKNSLAVFVNGGLSSSYALSITNNRDVERQYFTTYEAYRTEAVKGTRKSDFGWMLGLGTGIGKVSMEARMEQSVGMSEIKTVNLATTRYYFIVGYRFLDIKL